MPTRRALSLLDLVGAPGGAQALIPDKIASKLEGLGVIDYSSTTSDGAYIHHGTIQALADALPSLDQGWIVRAPGLTSGIPFQATIKRSHAGPAQNIEPAPVLYLIDLFIDRVEIELPFLRPAKLVERTGVRIGRLIESTKKTPVRLVGAGTLRIRIDSSGARVRFIDWPDPFDPDAPTGPVFRLSFDPPHFFFGKRSQLGMTVQDVVIDHSEQFTPAEIIARGHDDPWMGISIRRATMYFPRETPLLGDFTVGVRDLLLGSPLGIQGELDVEWGEDPLLDATMVEFFEVILDQHGQAHDWAMPIDNGVRVREVNFSEFSGGQARVRARMPALPPDRLCEWYIPGVVEPITTAGTPYFNVKEEDVVALHLTIIRDGRKVKGPMITFIMREATNDSQRAPKISLHKGSEHWDNVLYVGGNEQDLHGFVLKAEPLTPDIKLTWTVEGEPAGKAGNEFAVPVMPEIGVYDVVLTDNKKHQRRIRIDILPDSEVLIGYETGVARPGKPDATLLAVEKTYDLKQFYENGTPKTYEGDDAVLGGTILDVPAGAYAEVTVPALPALQDPPPPAEVPPPPVTPPIKHVQLQFDDTVPDAPDVSKIVGWGRGKNPEPDEPDFAVALRRWAKRFEAGTTFLLIGRCDDRYYTEHITLARQRAEIAQTILATAMLDEDFPGFDLSMLPLRAELEAPLATVEGTAATPVPAHDDFYDAEGTEDEPIAAASISPTLGRDQFLERKLYPNLGEDEYHERDPALYARDFYRRVDIYAIPGNFAPAETPVPNPEVTLDVGNRRVLVPADDAPIAAKPPQEPDLPYRVRVRVGWDSPTYVDISDAIPTLAEVALTWQAEPMPLPAADPADEEQETKIVACQTDPPTVPEYHTVVGKFTHDARSGDTIFSFAWSSEGDPNGLKCIPGKTLATAAALGPALMPGITTAAIDDKLVRIAALIAISRAVSRWAKYGEVVIHKIEIEQHMRDLDTLRGSKQRIMLDYSVELGVVIHSPIGNIESKDKEPLRVRYKNVGLSIDVSQRWWEAVSLIYDDVSFEVEKPGVWNISGPLGDLLRVTAFRSGSGSAWFEVDLAFALDLGVITISKAIIRVVLDQDNIDVQLRGFEASVSIPEVLEGTGRLDVGSPAGTIKGALELLIIPADLKAKGSLVYADGFFFLQVDTQFSSGLPIASSGLGIFGFNGRFVVNGKRALPAGNDPVQAELDWYALAPVDKYVAQPGQWAIGLGAVIGSMPDRAYVFNANAMLAVSWPDVSVVFGADATFVKKPPKRALETHAAPPPTSARIVGLVAIDSTAVKIGLKGSYSLPKLINLGIPVSGYFPVGANPDAFYLRIGSDGINGRFGQPIKATVLPDSLDLDATAFLMIEEKQLHNLGGKGLNFDGFSVGFGVRAGVDWSVWPISLSASAEIYAGLGTNPFHLAAGIYLRGSLDLGIASVTVSGNVTLDVTDDEVRARGEICGSVDLWITSISGCLDVEFGADPETIPPPPTPFLGIDLTDRFSRLTGAGTKTAPGAEHTVWPDTIPVLHFSHFVRNDLPATAQFKPPFAVPGPLWVGTSDLRYAFRLVDLKLEKADGTSAGDKLSSLWEFPSYRSAISTPNSPPAGMLDGRDLALLTWHPARWARNLGISGGDTSGDPANTLDGMCDPAPVPVRVCAFGKNLQRRGVDRVVLTPDAPSPGAFPSWFQVLGREQLTVPIDELVDLIAPQEMQYHPGVISPLGRSLPRPDADPITDGYALPYLTWHTRFVGSAGVNMQLAPALVDPELTILVCPGAARALEICDDFTDQPMGASLPQLTRDGVLYASQDPQQLLVVKDVFPRSGDRSPELAFPPKGMRITLPRAASSVRVRVVIATGDDVWTNVDLHAYNGAGQLVATQTPSMRPNEIMEITASGSDIHSVVLGHAGLLLSFCYTPSLSTGLLDALFGPEGTAAAPRVIGTTDTGVEQDWVVEIGAPTLPPATLARSANPCVFVRYKPKQPGLTWSSVRIAPYRRTRITVVAMCGVTWVAHQGAQDDQDARDGIKSWLDGLHLHGKLAQRQILESNTEYRVRVKLEYQAWRKTEAHPEPPSTLDETAWKHDWPTGVEEVYHFRTAPAVAPSTDPVDTSVETAFDVRAVKRHLIGFTPDTGSLPHFLDDSLGADFDVDHLEVLLAKYHRLLGLKLRRTDPPAGSRVGATTTPNEAITTAIGNIAVGLLALSDVRMVVASEGTPADPPCTQPFPPEGTHISIDADLEPDASYDLMLCAPPETTPMSDDILVARAHFHTSHYRSPSEMMAALGFPAGASHPYPPEEVVIDVDVPGAPVLADDRTFDDTLVALGLDPWPLARTPRTTVLWRLGGDTWFVTGVLLETNETLERGTRMGDLRMTLDTMAFTQVRSNAATTRILFAPASPCPTIQGSKLTLIVRDRTTDRSGYRTFVASQPLVVEEVA